MVDVLSTNELSEMQRKKMKEYRVNNNYTQKQFSKLLGIPPRTYIRYEMGFSLIPAEVLYRLIVTLDIPEGVFFPKSDVFSKKVNVIEALLLIVDELQYLINELRNNFILQPIAAR